MRRNLSYIVLTSLLFVCGTLMSFAQGDALDANIHISFETSGQKTYRTVQYALFKTSNKASTVQKALEEAIVLQRGDGGNIVLTAWDDALTKNKVKFRNSKGNGDFKIHAYPDMAILVSTYDPEDELTIEDARFQIIPLVEGQTEYEFSFKSTMDKGSQRIENVDVFGVNKDTINIVAAPPIDDGKNMYFRIHVDLPKQYGNSKYAGWYNVGPDDVDCFQTGAIVDLFVSKWGDGMRWVNKHDGGPHEANFLKLDCSKLKTTFGWYPHWNLNEAMEKIVEWSKAWIAGEDVRPIMDKQIELQNLLSISEIHSLDDDEVLTGRTLVSYSYGNVKEREVYSWVEMFTDVIKQIYDEDSSQIRILAADETYEYIVLSNTEKQGDWFKIAEDVYLHTHNSTNAKIRILNRVFEAYGKDKSELVFNLKADKKIK